MKSLCLVALGVVTALALVANVRAEDKEVTLKGTIVCGKCTLKDPDLEKCTTVLQVKDGDKTVNYYLKDEGKAEKYHKGICPPGSKAEATVTGTVKEEDGKKWITPTKVDVKEKE